MNKTINSGLGILVTDCSFTRNRRQKASGVEPARPFGQRILSPFICR